jgi:hypothetical protein
LATAACARGGARDRPADAGDDAVPADADSAPDAVADARVDAAADASGARCAIATGTTPTLGGSDDLAAYPAANQLVPGAALGSDGAAITWDGTSLYITVSSIAFQNKFEPLHIYVEAGSNLGSAAPAQGKQYSNLTPGLPFQANYLIAARQLSDGGTGAYDGVYAPDMTWDDRATPLALGSNVFVSPDQRTLSLAVPWAALGGCPTQLRLTMHVVHAVVNNEWKDLLPASTTPWLGSGGSYFAIDLTQPPAVASFALQ